MKTYLKASIIESLMKRSMIACSLACVCAVSFVNASGIFLGGGAGLGFGSQSGANASNDSSKAFSFVVRGGYGFDTQIGQPKPIKGNLTLSSAMGARAYLDYAMSIRPVGLDTTTTSLLAFNVDVVGNVIDYKEHSFGLFAGVGVGYANIANVVNVSEDDPALVDGFSCVVNLGLSGTFAHNHRVEFGFKIPLKTLESQGIEYKTNYMLLSYDYIF